MPRAAKVAIIVVAAVGVLTYGVLQWLAGYVVRWEGAYVALEAGEVIAPPRGGGDDERVRLANAMVESEAPRGMPTGRRIHRPGTLAHLRYEQLGTDGGVLSTTEVRALVPSLPYFGEDAPGGILGRTECPKRCAEVLASHDALQITRGGSPGLAPEWVLRMPVGPTYDLGKTSLTLQDLEDPRPISLPHAHYRVTLVEACPANTRVGSVTNLEFQPNAMLPIPKELRTRRWVQLEGCGALAKRKPPRAPAPVIAAVALEAPPYAYKPPDLRIVIPTHGPVGRALLIIDETTWVRLKLDRMHVQFHRICRHDAKGNQWLPLPKPEGLLDISGPGLMNRTRVAYRFDEGPGLYWAEWSEVPPENPAAAIQFALVIAGGTSRHCREGELPAPGPGEISLCIPTHGAARPGVVPDPAVACRG